MENNINLGQKIDYVEAERRWGSCESVSRRS